MAAIVMPLPQHIQPTSINSPTHAMLVYVLFMQYAIICYAYTILYYAALLCSALLTIRMWHGQPEAVLALTATAPRHVQSDIMGHLGITPEGSSGRTLPHPTPASSQQPAD